MLGFDIDAYLLTIALPAAKIAGDRVLFAKLSETQGPGVIEAVTLKQVRGNIEHFESPNALWEFLAGPIDLLSRYTNEQVICPTAQFRRCGSHSGIVCR